ncbi:MAG: amino acid lyase [Bacteroidales bacterium]|nr:amino acid lyase [Bacteroidales bacterium]
MLNFECDYNNGAHPKILENLVKTNNTQSLTYGFDEWSERAKIKIKKACNKEDADIFFLCGGTQTNATVIDGMLNSYEGVIASDEGHISVHEAGAVEAFGHKVITLKSKNGKISAEQIENYLNVFENDESRDHVAQPGMVYLTFPTEFGTIYSKKEIYDVYSLCRRYELSLFIDGARLGYGLMCEKCDFDLPWLADHCDCFYIGGTKVGALCGEAVVFTHHNAPKRFFSIIKRHGALMAKGRLAGIQFDTLFTDNLYFEISKHAVQTAQQLKDLLQQAGFSFYLDSPTNQQFVIIPNDKVKELEKKVIFTHWFPFDEKSFVCRFVTSWATTQQEMDELRKILLS